jgi:hypothetical protein
MRVRVMFLIKPCASGNYMHWASLYFYKLSKILIAQCSQQESSSKIAKWAKKYCLVQITTYCRAVTVTTFTSVISILITLFSLLLLKLEFLHELIYCSWFPFFLFLWPLFFLLQVKMTLSQKNYADWLRQGDQKNIGNFLTFFSGSFANDGGKKMERTWRKVCCV